MEFELLPDYTELYSKNSGASKQTLSIRFPAVTALGVTLEKERGSCPQTNIVYKIPCSDCTWSYIGEWTRQLPPNAKKTKHKKSEMSNIATKAPTIQTMHGRTIIKSTLIPLK